MATLPKFKIPRPDDGSSGNDGKATKEAAAYALGLDISKKETDNQLRKLERADHIDWHVHYVLVLIIWSAGLMLFLMGIAFVINFIGPEWMRFLDHDRFIELKNFLFTGATGAGLAALARSKLGVNGDKRP